MQYAFRALAQRALSEHELRTRLHKRGATDAEIERVIERLREFGYVNDAALARAANERRGVGPMRVRQDLVRRGVDRDTVEDVLQNRDDGRDEEEVRALVERHRERWQRARDPKARAFGFLARRGFQPGVIWTVLREAGLGDGKEP